MTRPSIVLVSREIDPFVGGGIAPIVRATAEALAPVADVTLVTTSTHRERYEALTADGPLYPEGVRVLFAEEPPHERGHYYHSLQAWGHRVFETLLDAFPGGGPDLIEFPDYCAEGFVTIQAKRAGEPGLRHTTIAVRTHTTAELVGVLNGHLGDELPDQAVREMERYCLRHADRLLWPGGDVLGTYQRFYGAEALAPAVHIPDAFLVPKEPTPAVPEPDPGTWLKLLFLGRYERRKGIENLLRALLTMEYEGWTLDIVGGDTRTGPLGVSMQRRLRLSAETEDRVTLRDPVPRSAVPQLMAEHDAVVVPSRWECWPNVAREAFLHGRPVIATPVGGLVDMVRPGVSGWLAEDASVDALRKLIDPLARDPEQVRALGRTDGPRRVLAELTDTAMIRGRYLRLIEDAPAPRPHRTRSRADLVSIVVPYYRMDAFVEDTLRSVAAQTHPRVETVVVNDGSIRAEDAILERLAGAYDMRVVTQQNRGLGSARNFGIAHARGRYVLPLDSDDLIDPDFVERCVAGLERNPDLAYVGTWSRYVDEDLQPMDGADPGYTPLGNWSALTELQNVAGTASALIRRHLFDEGLRYSHELTSYEDWHFYLQLRRMGLLGEIIPRAMLTYRIRRSSMLRATGNVRWDRLRGELAALLAESRMQWTSPSD